MKKIYISAMTAALLAVTSQASFAIDTSVSDILTKADKGDVKAQVSLGSIYANCTGVPCNPDEALKWYTKAADQGSAEAKYDIGNLYMSSQLLMNPNSHVQQDDKEAVKWWRKSAEQGYLPAETKLGHVYDAGLTYSDFKGKYRKQLDAIRPDYPEAMKWYQKAASQGDTASKTAIGDMYAEGHGVPQDYVQAYIWYSRSPSVSGAQANDLLNNKMSEAQIAEAEKQTQGWKPEPVKLTQKPGVPAGLLANPFIHQYVPKNPPPPVIIPTTWQTAVSRAGVGDRMPDGSIYLGKFRSVRWFVMDHDVGKPMSYDQAQAYAQNLHAHGHADWKIPDQDILEQMYGNRHKGSFSGSYNESGNFTSGWYWSSTQNPKFANTMLGQWFTSGNSGWIPKTNTFSVRLVRSMTQ